MTEASNLSWFTKDTRWDNEIQAAGIKFHEQEGIYPNTFIASQKTHEYLNTLAAVEPENIQVVDEHGFSWPITSLPTPEAQSEATPLTDYRCSLFELMFCIDDTLPYLAFTVDFIDPRKWDEEDLPEEGTIAL